MMDVNINPKRQVSQVGDMVSTENDHLYVIVKDEDERAFPYHLVCLRTFTVIQSYDELPTDDELEEDIGETISAVFSHHDANITLDER
ncbi:hypothetical protein E2L07_14815 [Halalkalibacterium halodurans]|uniref:hypothetical protein n=1 Tax=Halalkalibacterium halodurans TaxID=86665 RepID=UPI001068C5E2|nr:hypothetical protein [Halalkalibacterium halodurans]TES51855.1 hypothetical protein E2L07_14815 [Halalkalibacterium halodurans]